MFSTNNSDGNGTFLVWRTDAVVEPTDQELADAKKVVATLIDAGFDAYIQKAVFKETNEIWYRVRVGSYDNRDTAVAVAESLSSTRRERAWVDFVRYEY